LLSKNPSNIKNIPPNARNIEAIVNLDIFSFKSSSSTSEMTTSNSNPNSSSINFLLSDPDARIIGILGLILESSRDLFI
jgi:hypothetical protein